MLLASLGVLASSASAATSTLPDSSTYVLHGNRGADGECEFSKQPSATLNPGEGAIESRPIATDESACTQTWERGKPSKAELAAEGVPGGSPQAASVEEGSSSRASAASRRHRTAHAAATKHHDYVFAREHNAGGGVINAINVTVEYYTNGSSITSCVSERAKWEWEPGEGWSLGTHNDNTGCATNQIYSSAYGIFNNQQGCTPEYNRTAIFAYPSGRAEGFGPIYKCYNPPPYAWFITEE